MNIVFWIILVIALVLLWFLLAPLFSAIGILAMNIFSGAKNEMINEKKHKNNESEDK